MGPSELLDKFWGPVKALQVLHYSKREAEERILQAIRDFVQAGKRLDENELLNHAVRLR